MPTQIETLLEETIEVDASPARVWSLVSDLRRMASWSPQVQKPFVRGGGPSRLGTRTLNVNRRGLLVWPTRAKVVRFEPHREIAHVAVITDGHVVAAGTVDEVRAGSTLEDRFVALVGGRRVGEGPEWLRHS